ncbi:hypothetical protein Plec18167_005362 [Paecilomyces lecythidis]|uniref:Uncharacterized protein n=1 Tax=Paecilomyces lecythidis TaxID=3004212 RepID=A0ABR3XK38_9EURO
MSEFPHKQDPEERMADNMKNPSLPPPGPTPEGISELLAAISKLEKRDRLQTEPTEETPLTGSSDFAVRVPKRVAEVLDSLASLSVCQPKHEVIAVVLRLNPKPQSVELIISGNSDISSSTLNHLRYIWSSMKSLSEFIYRDRSPGLQDKSSNEKMKDPAFQAIVTELRYRCLVFSFARIQHIVNGKFEQFMRISTAELAPEHPFNSIRKSLSFLERLFTRKEGAVFGKPRHGDAQNLRYIYTCLRTFSKSSDQFLRAGGFQGQDKGRSVGFLKLHSYLQKIASIPNNIDDLIKAAVSPRCRDLFTCTLNLIPLPKLSGRLSHVASTTSDWERVLEESLAYYNKFLDFTRTSSQVLDTEVINPDTIYMAREAVSRDVIVHSETKLLAAIENAQRESKNIPKAFTYVGVSKPPCNGCVCFFTAYNRVHDTSWETRRRYGKSYYPWMLPPVLPGHDEVVTATYNIIVARWVRSYRGYRDPFVPVVADSTQPRVPATEYYDEQAPADMEVVREIIRQLEQ